ncbi:IQ calmodulin-binding domain containing protein igloo isoform X2 [Musca autumnalis]|uniref:IQ calmodulin-binding domain containing protein igloo isoform X2 n=1 Tax=Musca autumnalis TaxID=221902 RepID=UPI003CEEE415
MFFFSMLFARRLSRAKAATKIQAVFRGHKVRATMKKSETQTPSSNNIPASGAAAATENEPTKEELEAEFDPNDKELCSAALKIQATFRGHLTRKLVAKDTPEDVDIQEITKKVAEELDIDLSDPELNKAATKIQASFRGHKTRKDTQPVE